MDIAAAFLKQAMGELDQNNNHGQMKDFGDTGAEEGMVRLFINIGKKQKVRPGDILGAVAGESARTRTGAAESRQDFPCDVS